MKDRHAVKAATKQCVVCGTKLSAYNQNPTCYAHTLGLPWTGPSTRPKQPDRVPRHERRADPC